MKEIPEVLNNIVDLVLGYRPKAKIKAARKRKRPRSDKQKKTKSRRLSNE
jgi:hypothetical protein